MSIKGLREQIRACEEFATQRKEELARLTERLASLEAVRTRNFAAIASDNGNSRAQRELDQNDAEIAEVKKQIAAHKRRMQYGLRTMRTRLLQAQEEALRNLQSNLKAQHDEQSIIKNVLIPEAEQNLAALQEKGKQNQDSIQHTQQEIEEFNQLRLDNLF